MENLNITVAINTNLEDPIQLPSPGVTRVLLEHEDVEKGRATFVITFEAGASFVPHTHPLGEEIFVLEGTFSDENGDYPDGTYIRNPPGSSHSPFSKDGCVLFVKQNGMDLNDKEQVVIDTTKSDWRPGYGNLEVLPLHDFGTENSALVKWPKGEKFIQHSHYGGEEIFVISGEFIDEHGRYPAGTWIRSPHLSTHCPYVEDETIIFVKTGHLHS